MIKVLVIYCAIILLCLSAIPILSEQDYAYWHENAHKSVYGIYGCQSEIFINAPFADSYTKTINCSMTLEEMEKVDFAQSLVEIVGYHMKPIHSMLIYILISILAGICVYSFYKILNSELKEWEDDIEGNN